MERRQGSERCEGRSIDRILARRRARRRRRVHTMAPDVLHGDCRLGAIYDVFGREWVEQTAFVERVVGSDGATVGWTVATFEERFLTLTHGVAGELDDLEQWLGEQLEGTERVVRLEVSGDSDAPRGAGDESEREVMAIRATRARLQKLERKRLRAVRDRDFGRVSGRRALLEERLLQSRVDVMSLICLCARLV